MLKLILLLATAFTVTLALGDEMAGIYFHLFFLQFSTDFL